MTDDTRPAEGHDETIDEDGMANILRVAGKRPPIDTELRDVMREAARRAWKETLDRPATEAAPKVAPIDRHRRRRSTAWRVLPLAAALVIAAGLAVFVLRDLDPAPPSSDPGTLADTVIATVEARFPATDTDALPAVGSTLRAGDLVVTGDGDRLALLVGNGPVRARVDHSTRLRLVSASVLELDRGAVYLDTGNESTEVDGEPALTIRTPYGLAQDIGTRFETRAGADGLVVRVRDGVVEVVVEGPEAEPTRHRAPAGTVLAVDPGGSVERGEIVATDAAWAWTLAAAPPFDAEGRTLEAVLTWVGRETGWRIRYADAATEAAAGAVVIQGSGSLDGLGPDEVPDLVVPISGFTHRRVGDTLWIEPPGDR